METTIKIDKKNYLLMASLILAPMTGLRIWKIGPAEVLCFIWCIQFYKEYGQLKFNDYVVSFWLMFFYSITLGLLYGVIFYPDESTPSQLLTFLYLMLISFGVYIGMQKKTLTEIEIFLETTSFLSSLWYLFLYLYSIYVSPMFFNAPLWYASIRFTGGGTNPHQLAILISVIIFINYRSILKKKLKYKIKHLLCIAICLFICNAINSSTLTISISITAILALIYGTINLAKIKKQKSLVTFLIFILIFFAITFYYQVILDIFYDFIKSDPNGIGRLKIFSSIEGTLRKNVVFGLGPGVHGLDGLVEYHNTYLEIIAMSGVIGLSIFILFTIRMYIYLKPDYTLKLIVIPLYVYGIGGFALRRLAYWIILMIVIVIAEKVKEEQELYENYSIDTS